MRPEHVTRTLTNSSAVLLSRVFSSVSCAQNTALPLEEVLVTLYGRISYIYTVWYNLDTVLCQFIETGTSVRCLIGIFQLLRISGFSLYPHFFLNIRGYRRGIRLLLRSMHKMEINIWSGIQNTKVLTFWCNKSNYNLFHSFLICCLYFNEMKSLL